MSEAGSHGHTTGGGGTADATGGGGTADATGGGGTADDDDNATPTLSQSRVGIIAERVGLSEGAGSGNSGLVGSAVLSRDFTGLHTTLRKPGASSRDVHSRLGFCALANGSHDPSIA
jgi:hypothetical protein